MDPIDVRNAVIDRLSIAPRNYDFMLFEQRKVLRDVLQGSANLLGNFTDGQLASRKAPQDQDPGGISK